VQRGGRSLLEQIVTLDSTRNDYRRRLDLFLSWLCAHNLSPATTEEVLLALMDFLDEMFFSGASHADGSKLLAALLDLMPKLPGCTVGLARAQRALRGWSKRAPANSRFPPPAVAILSIVFDRQLPVHSLGVLVQFLAYLRPGELLAILAGQLIPPNTTGGLEHWAILLHPVEGPLSSKFNERDESLLLDAPGWEAVSLGLSELRSRRRSHELLWPFDYASYAHEIETSVARCDLGQFGIVSYSFKHGRASHDALNRVRSLEQIKLRGRWQSDSSLQRYTKPARAQQFTNLLSPEFVEYVRRHRELLVGIFRGQSKLACPPWLSAP
jgi:hypothetical protein